MGIAGPLRVNGVHAQGDYYVPLATTEATLVASYSRGALTITEAGGCAAAVLNEGVTRAPGFAFDTLADAGHFVGWCIASLDAIREVAHATTRHGRLNDVQCTIEGSSVYIAFEFTTGDASGQNMVTIATEAICRHLEAHAPVKPRYYFLEANMSGDKKASHQSFLNVRGRKVTAEVLLPGALVGIAPARHAAALRGLLADGRDGRRAERHHRRAGPLRQRPGGALHRVRTGRGVRGGVGRGHHALRSAERRRPLRRRSRCPT